MEPTDELVAQIVLDNPRGRTTLAWRSPQETAGYAVRQWLGSPPHRAALLSSTWTVMGVELTPRYATVEFGRRC